MGARDSQGLPTSFLAVSASQVCEQQWLRPINDTLYCNHALCGWCSKVNTTGNELLGSRYSPLDMQSIIYMDWRGGKI